MIHEVAGETEKSPYTYLPFLFLLSTVIVDQSSVDEDADIREGYRCCSQTVGYHSFWDQRAFHRGLLYKAIEKTQIFV